MISRASFFYALVFFLFKNEQKKACFKYDYNRLYFVLILLLNDRNINESNNSV